MMKISTIYEMIAHHYINKKRVTRPIDLSCGRKLLIMATGKSANEYWDNSLIQQKFTDYDMLVMNRSIYKMQEQIFEKKPRFFALCDPIYWGEKRNTMDEKLLEDTYYRTKAVLEKINWECYLITSVHEKFDFINDKIHIIRLNSSFNDEENKLAYKFYEQNFCCPTIANVGQLAIYFGITFGYKEVALVGMDFDFFKNLFCDEKCVVGLYAEHQYDERNDKVVELKLTKEVYGTKNGSILANYLLNIVKTFETYGKLNMYAIKQGSKIFNYSSESMLDCYEKRRMSD